MRGFLADPSLRSAFFAFTLTRLLILFVILLSANMTFEPTVRDQIGDIHESDISLRNTRPADVFRRVALGADSLWIINIARAGYEKESFNTSIQHTWAYFPLYPLLLRAVAWLTGDLALTGIFLSSAFFFFALILLYRTVIAFNYDPAVADRTVFYLAAFPASYFFSLAQTESLFLLLTVGCFYAAKRERWWLAGLCGALASATRFAGVFLLVPMAVMYWQIIRSRKGRIRMDVASLLLVPLGLIAFMIYLKSITGNALAFAEIQVAWGHSPVMFWRPLVGYLLEPLRVSAGWDFRLLNFAAAAMALICSFVLLKRREWAFAFYSLISILVPLSYQVSLQSLARYVMVIFPVFVVLAWVGRSPRADQIIRLVFIALLSLMSAMLAVRVTLALS
jgi:Gpi18-like mannosyltransferase